MTLTHERFEVEKHLHLLDEWTRARGMSQPDPGFLPPTGFVVSIDGVPAALGFQIRCDNRMAINSDLISDPTRKKFERNQAVEFLRHVLCRSAESAGFQFLTVFTSIPNHEARLKKLGYTVLEKNLTQLGRFLWL